MPERRGSTVIENVQPQLDGGRYPVARLAGEPLRVTADIFKEGHDELAAVVRWRQLTPRETDVLELLQRGRSNGEIAETLHISIETVRTHARRIYRKLGVSTRRELVARR